MGLEIGNGLILGGAGCGNNQSGHILSGSQISGCLSEEMDDFLDHPHSDLIFAQEGELDLGPISTQEGDAIGVHLEPGSLS